MKKPIYFFVIIACIIAGYFFGINIAKNPDKEQLSLSFRDGKHLGFIHNIDTDNLTLAFDDAIWLTGTAAQDAAIEAGHCTEADRSECTPNDYFIKNEKVGDEPVSFDSNVLLFMQTWKMEETGEVTTREIGLADFAKLLNDSELHWRNLPYNITVQNGKVVRIEEVYIP